MWKRRDDQRRYLSCLNKAAARSLSPDSLKKGLVLDGMDRRVRSSMEESLNGRVTLGFHWFKRLKAGVVNPVVLNIDRRILNEQLSTNVDSFKQESATILSFDTGFVNDRKKPCTVSLFPFSQSKSSLESGKRRNGNDVWAYGSWSFLFSVNGLSSIIERKSFLYSLRWGGSTG